MMAFPTDILGLLGDHPSPGSRGQGTPVVAAETAARRDTLDAAMRRTAGSPGEISFDVLLCEAMLLAKLGDERAARRRLEPTLDSLYLIQPGMLEQHGRAAAFVRAMALEAELLSQTDRREARKWATAVEVLWADGEEAIRPTLDRMRVIARR